MDGIIINDEVYKLVEDNDEDFDCKDCALEEYCGNFGESTCTSAFISAADSYRHFEKVEKTSSKSDKQPETSNQSYFY